MKIKVELNKFSDFNSQEHFFDCLNDLLEEWNDTCSPKEMNKEDVGFNYTRFEELKTAIRRTK
tara:strand:- start:230 stop:418 length:189 start_codon:yes stop_codon:yes gene_type:complete